MKPTIITLPAFTLVGATARFISAMSPDANNMKVIPPLWHEFATRKEENGQPLDGFAYGACRCLPPSRRSRDDELEYLAGLNVDPSTPVPKGMGRWNIAAGTYAHFVHRGPIARLCDTIGFANGTWLPSSGYRYAGDGVELERYDHRFNTASADSELDFLLPITPKQG